MTAYGLTSRQSILANSLVQTGSIHESARALQLPYSAARNTLADIKIKLGVPTVGTLIGHLLDLDYAEVYHAACRHHDLHDLTDRQLEIAATYGIVPSRREIAKRLNISQSVLDMEMKQIHLALGIRDSGALPRLVAAATAQALTTPEDAQSIPSASITRNGRTISFSDFGPVAGWPVLVLHSTITARAPPSRLVAALRAAGGRPIAIDRPGFGDTSAAPDPSTDPYALAADDIEAVCAQLNIPAVDVVARGSGQAAVRLAQCKPALVRHAVLVNPTPSIHDTPADRGPLGAVKRRFAKKPVAVELMIKALSAFGTPNRIKSGMLRSFQGSPPDLALVDEDPQYVADYLRAVRGFGQGKIAGYVAEQTMWANGYDVEPLPRMAHWAIVQAGHFILHSPAEAIAYWASRLPDTPVTWVNDAGQLLAYSHPQSVVDALVRLRG